MNALPGALGLLGESKGQQISHLEANKASRLKSISWRLKYERLCAGQASGGPIHKRPGNVLNTAHKTLPLIYF